jgi:hypothetical protein
MAILLISLLTITVFPFSTSQTSKERPRPRPPTTNKPLSELMKETYSGLKFVNTPTLTKESQLKTMPVSQVKVDPSLTQKIASAGPLGKVPVIVEFNMGVAKPADIRKGSAFMNTFATAAVATTSGSALVHTGFYPQVSAFEANVTANLVDALSRMPQVAHIYDPTIKAHILNQYSTQYHQAVIAWTWDAIGTGAIVAVLDSGWDGWSSYTTGICPPNGCGPHPDLTNLASPYTSVAVRDFTGLGAYDLNGHGTHVEGIAVGQGIQDSTQTGIAPGAKLMVGKVCDDTGSCPWGSLIRGMIWANGIDPDNGYPTALKANVISMSIGGYCSTCGDGTSIVEQVVDEVARQGSLPVIAAGNSGGEVGAPGTINVPASAKNSVAVAATDWDQPGVPIPWRLTSWSSRGPTYDGRDKPDLSAIGHYVTSSVPPTSNIFGAAWPPYYGTISGTSMATPQVSGGGADLASGRTNAQTDALKAMLLSTWQGAYDMQDYNGYGVGWDQAGLGFLQIDDSFHTEFYTGTVTSPSYNYNAATDKFTSIGAGTWVYFKFYEPDPYVPIRVVLTWLDPSTSAGSAHYGSLVHDLDLFLYDPSGHLVASSNSFRNNVEYIDFWSESGAAVGTYTIGVHYYANRLGYDPTQHFAVSLRSACNTIGCNFGPPVAPITGETIASGAPVPYMRPTDTLKATDSFTNLRASTDAWGTGGGLRGIDIEHWLYSDMTGWVWIGWNWVTLNPGISGTTTFSMPLASYQLPYGLYWLEEDAFTYYPTNGNQFVAWQDVGASYQDRLFYITPPMAAVMLSVKTNVASYVRGATGTVTFTMQNVGTQPYTGAVTLLLMGTALSNPIVIASKQIPTGTGIYTGTITVTWPTSLPAGPNTYTLVASTGTQGWTSTATTTVTIT